MIEGLYEAHLPVRNLAVSIAFYNRLGLKLAWQDEDSVYFWIVEGESWIGLWEGKEMETPYHPALRHFAFRTTYDKIKQSVTWLNSLGIQERWPLSVDFTWEDFE
ncbi:hypothetical protein BVG16_02650 [Paenibacillus selenitireducens]|uniref:VOC domain-containing protein n=1 Tax=Paenibacillus selenitireducens TaxID=1324314 RepID=A0A1T2XMZ3_9BACL|nr:hypothetical protein BVG16_02650 [Paenibacillus selenitireducens]